MARLKKRKSKFIKLKKKFLDKKKLRTLLAAGTSLPCLGFETSLEAQSFPSDTSIRIQYMDYEDYQDGNQGGERMRIKVPMLWFQTPVTDDVAVEGSFVIDSMSGASPLYLNTLTGASGRGVKDTRRAGDLKVSKHYDQFSISVGGKFSHEDDYDSSSGLVETRIWTPEKNTVFSIGGSASYDDITSTNNPALDEVRQTYGHFFGLTQVLDRYSIIQSNLNYNSADGYLTDQYKSADNRPRSRDQYAWLTRYRRFFKDIRGALHADYRFYFDSWEVISHTLDLAFYKPLGNYWIIRPNLRYYTQRGAQFFSTTFPPRNQRSFYSADQRMGSFGGITSGIKLERSFGSGYSAHLLYEFIHQRASLKLGGGGDSEVEPFSARFIGLGISKKW